MSAARNSFELLEVAGPDAERFLQAQLSSDLRSLAPGQGQFSAWLNPQGRVLAFLPLFRRNPETFVLAVAFARGQELAERLRRFVFRSKVRIAPCQDCALAHGAIVPLNALASLAVPGTAARYLWLQSDAPGDVALCEPGRSDVEAGLPFLDAAHSEQFIGHALGLKRLGAISVGKGCYPGQEIVARTHFLGRNKRALCRLSGLDPTQPDLRVLGVEGQALGELALAVGDVGLAVLHEPEPGMTVRDAGGRTLVLEHVFFDS